jgi:hypothetical protein
MAMAAQTSNTIFDRWSLNLPSIGTLAGFYHACLGFPIKQAWLEAIKAGNCDTFDGLTNSNAARCCPNSNKRIFGHLVQQRQNIRSAKPKAPKPETSSDLPPMPPSTVEEPSNQVFVKVFPLSKLYTDDTGCLPVRACLGNQYVMIAFHANSNLIHQQALKSKRDHQHCRLKFHLSCLAAQDFAVEIIMQQEGARMQH